jgi:hypothetical protein
VSVQFWTSPQGRGLRCCQLVRSDCRRPWGEKFTVDLADCILLWRSCLSTIEHFRDAGNSVQLANQSQYLIFTQRSMYFGVLQTLNCPRGAAHYQPPADRSGPSWLTFLGHAKDSLHSIDLFRCESVALRTYWVLVVMDQYIRRIIGFGVHRGIVDGLGLCRMFNRAIRWQTVPKYLSSDHDPLYQFHQWQANLRVLGVAEIKTVPYVPMSHPFVERLIGTIRREYLDVALFWTAVDLESKLSEFRDYYNLHRSHAGDLEIASLAWPLSWALSHANRGLSRNSPRTGVTRSRCLEVCCLFRR